MRRRPVLSLAHADGTRKRRTHDLIRQRWYALWRALRFAWHMGFR